MKVSSRTFVLLLVLLLALPTKAQELATISQLKDQIATIESIENDPVTTHEVKDLNSGFLKERRLLLRTLLIRRIEALRKYQSTVQRILSAGELEVVSNSIRDLELELQGLERVILNTTSAMSLTVPTSDRLTVPYSVKPPPIAPPKSLATNLLVDTSPAGSMPAESCYPNVPKVIGDEVDDVVADIVRTGDAGRISNNINELIVNTVYDALTQTGNVSIRALNSYVYIGETVRTDKQTGASASAEGTTSAAEKPGWAEILGFAIEHGAIQKEVAGTTLTLSTTPYAFAVPSAEDTVSAYKEYGYLKRFAISATFKISNEDNPLANARRKDLSEYSVKVRLSEDRGPRSDQFNERWEKLIKPAIVKHLGVIARGQSTLFSSATGLSDYGDTIEDDLTKDIGDYLAANAGVAVEKRKTDVKEKILCTLRNKVFDETKEDGSGKIKINPTIRTRIIDDLIPALFRAQEGTEAAKEILAKIYEDFERKPFASLAYTNKHQDVGSDYSIIKFLYQRYLGTSPVKFNFNIGATLYHSPDVVLKQESLRDFATSFSFEGRRKSPFISSDLDLSPMTYTFTGRYQRMPENRGIANKKADLGVLQFRLEIPISSGVSVPVSLTYANATEEQNEQHVRGNFGLTFDFDKFLSLRRLLSGKK